MLQKLKDWWDGKPELAPRSPKWAGFCKGIVDAVGHCESCGVKDQLEGHHKRPYHLWPELELVRSNVKVMCRPCHFLIGHFKDWKSYNRDVDTDCYNLANKVNNRPYTKDRW